MIANLKIIFENFWYLNTTVVGLNIFTGNVMNICIPIRASNIVQLANEAIIRSIKLENSKQYYVTLLKL